MIRALIAQVFCALESYVRFLAVPRAVVSVFGAEKQTLWQRQKQWLRLWLSRNVLIN